MRTCLKIYICEFKCTQNVLDLFKASTKGIDTLVTPAGCKITVDLFTSIFVSEQTSAIAKLKMINELLNNMN